MDHHRRTRHVMTAPAASADPVTLQIRTAALITLTVLIVLVTLIFALTGAGIPTVVLGALTVALGTVTVRSSRALRDVRARERSLIAVSMRLSRLLQLGWSVHHDVPWSPEGGPSSAVTPTIDFAVAAPSGVSFAVMALPSDPASEDFQDVALQAAYLTFRSRSMFPCQGVVCVTTAEDLSYDTGTLVCSPDRLTATLRARETHLLNAGVDGLSRLHR